MKVLKILNVQHQRDTDTFSIAEAVNLRAGSRLNLNTSSNDVKWSLRRHPITLISIFNTVYYLLITIHFEFIIDINVKKYQRM